MKPRIRRAIGASVSESKVHRLARVSVAVVRGREGAARREIAASLDAAVPAGDLREAILQTYLFAGFPCAINGLWVLDEELTQRERASSAGLKGFMTKAAGTLFRAAFDLAEQRLRPRSRAVLRSDGETLCRKIYGSDYEPMIAKMKRLSPELAEWILEEGYGKVLSRPHFSAGDRELLVVPTLVAVGGWRQLTSHIRGAVRLGVSVAQLRSVVEGCRDLLSPVSMKRWLKEIHATE